MLKAIELNKLKDGIIDKGTDLISKVNFSFEINCKTTNKFKFLQIQIIKDATDDTVNLDSIGNGQIKVDANAYVDKAVSLLNNKLESNNLNSLDLPDLGFDFSYDVACGIDVPGTVDIQDGTINGLANFGRTSDSELSIDVRSDNFYYKFS